MDQLKADVKRIMRICESVESHCDVIESKLAFIASHVDGDRAKDVGMDRIELAIDTLRASSGPDASGTGGEGNSATGIIEPGWPNRRSGRPGSRLLWTEPDEKGRFV